MSVLIIIVGVLILALFIYAISKAASKLKTSYNGGSVSYTDTDILQKGKSIEAENIVTGVATWVLWWGNILAWVNAIVCLGLGIALIGFDLMGGNFAVMSALGVVTIILSPLVFFFWRMVAKIMWGVIMLFVNMSTTLKRIESILEQGSH